MARRLSPYVSRRRGRLGAALLFSIGYTVMGLVEPWTMKLILDNVLLQRPLPGPLEAVLGENNRLTLLNLLIVAIILIAGLRGLFYYYQKLLMARAGQQAVADMRLDLYRHLQLLSFRFHDRRRTGDLLTRLTSDIRFLRDIFISLPLTLMGEILLVCGMVTVMFFMDWSLTLLALSAIPALALMLRLYQRPMRNAIRRQREREGEIASIASEVLGAIKIVQGFRREEYEVDRFTVQNKRSLRTGLKASRLEAKFRWYSEITVAVVVAVVIGVAVRRVLAGALSPGDLLVFVSYLRAFTRPLRRVSRMAERAARGTVAGERVLRMLEIEPTVRDRKDAVAVKGMRGEVAFENVSVTQPGGAAALTGIDLKVASGERIGLVGPTGSGKTTLVSLIPRFYDPTQGTVRVDGRDVSTLTLASLRDHIALVFQEPILFSTTITENVRYGNPDATDEDIVRTAQEAGLHDIVSRLPDGYDTVLGERGGTLSGGERQCVAVARALIKDAPIVILDEPSAGLDSRSSTLVMKAMERLMKGRTVFLISHQLENMRGMDRVVVLDRGRIVDVGRHDELLVRSSLYRGFHRLQVGGVT
jgi:ABC-type multidrug transport system fused ATPase/permease subunit